MSVSYAPTKLRVPLGFEHLLEALAREVLREQPKDIINFAAEYFRRKLVLRDEGTLDSIIAPEKTTATKGEDVQSKQVQPSVEQDVVNTDLSDPEVHKAASTIQAQFRSHRKREEAKRNPEKTQSEVVDDKETSDQPPDVLSNLDLDDPELNKAASVIQSNFRTYLNKNKRTTEQAETQNESEDTGDNTEPSMSQTEDPDSTKAESTMDKITPATEESNADEQLLPPAEVQKEPEDKEESVSEPSSSENQEKMEQEGDPKEVPSQLADEEQPAETEGEGGSKETEPQVEGGGESEELPVKNEETKEEDSGGDDGNGGEVEPADEDTAIENVEQAEATHDGEKQEGAPEGDEATGDPKEEPSDEAS